MAKVAAAAAVAANQYLSASLSAANNAASHYRYPQYLNNHFDLSKSNQIDCRRTSNPHYSSHLASHLQYQGKIKQDVFN